MLEPREFEVGLVDLKECEMWINSVLNATRAWF